MLNFIHIPKCGGSTIRSIMRMYFRDLKAGGDDKKTIFVYGEDGNLGDYSVSSLNSPKIKHLSGVGSCEIAGIVGHYNYESLSQFMGGNLNIVKPVSLVRNPIERMISLINYKKIRGTGFSQIDQQNIVEYLIKSSVKNNNIQCVYLGMQQGELVTKAKLRSRIFKYVNVYKLNNTKLLINNHMPSESKYQQFERKNVSLQLNQQIGGSPQMLIDINAIDSNSIALLEGLYAADFMLFDMAK